MRRTRGASETERELREAVERYRARGSLVMLARIGEDRILWWDRSMTKKGAKCSTSKA